MGIRRAAMRFLAAGAIALASASASGCAEDPDYRGSSVVKIDAGGNGEDVAVNEDVSSEPDVLETGEPDSADVSPEDEPDVESQENFCELPPIERMRNHLNLLVDSQLCSDAEVMAGTCVGPIDVTFPDVFFPRKTRPMKLVHSDGSATYSQCMIGGSGPGGPLQYWCDSWRAATTVGILENWTRKTVTTFLDWGQRVISLDSLDSSQDSCVDSSHVRCNETGVDEHECIDRSAAPELPDQCQKEVEETCTAFSQDVHDLSAEFGSFIEQRLAE